MLERIFCITPPVFHRCRSDCKLTVEHTGTPLWWHYCSKAILFLGYTHLLPVLILWCKTRRQIINQHNSALPLFDGVVAGVSKKHREKMRHMLQWLYSLHCTPCHIWSTPAIWPYFADIFNRPVGSCKLPDTFRYQQHPKTAIAYYYGSRGALMLSGKGRSTNQLLRGGLHCDMVDHLSNVWIKARNRWGSDVNALAVDTTRLARTVSLTASYGSGKGQASWSVLLHLEQVTVRTPQKRQWTANSGLVVERDALPFWWAVLCPWL